MSSWKSYKLGDIAEITSSKRIFYSEYVPSGIPFWRSKEVIEKFNRKNISTDLFISNEKYQEIKSKFGVPQQNDILLTSVGTLGIPYLVQSDEQFYFKDGNLTWIKNINNELLNPLFLFKWLASSIGRESLSEITIGSTQEALTISGLKTLELLLPPLEEQKAIAEILSSLDDKIDLLHRQNQTLECLAQTLFRQWFIEEAKEEWEIKFSDAPIQIIDGDRGNNYPKNSDFFANEYCLFLSARNVTKNGFDFSDCQFITKERDELLRKGKLSRNDVVLTTRGTVGNIAYYHELIPFENIRINSGMVILRADETKISPLYLYILMKSPLFCESVIEHTSGSAQPQLPIRDLNNVSFILPPKNIYYKFMEQVKPIYSKVFNNQKQIQTLENLRDTLLPKLLSGEVRI